MFKQAKEISDDKVNIAVHTYELVDKHIRKLDSDLAKFESEMKVSFLRLNFHSRKVNQNGVTSPIQTLILQETIFFLSTCLKTFE